jgi:hypothetical protein
VDAYLKCLSKFIGHEIVENWIYARRNIVENPRDVSRVRKESSHHFTILISTVCYVYEDKSLLEGEGES